MTSEKKYPPIKLLEFEFLDDGSVFFDFDISEEFEIWFKEEHNLKRWSAKKFNSWVFENIEDFLEESRA
jgi:hypothetical protein